MTKTKISDRDQTIYDMTKSVMEESRLPKEHADIHAECKQLWADSLEGTQISWRYANNNPFGGGVIAVRKILNRVFDLVEGT